MSLWVSWTLRKMAAAGYFSVIIVPLQYWLDLDQSSQICQTETESKPTKDASESEMED